MRAFSAAVLALTLSISGAVAASQDASLTPGKPAGVKQARMENTPTIMVVAGVALVATGIALAASGNSNTITPATATITTTPTTTG